LAIGRYPLHAEFFDRLLGGPSLPSVFDDRSTALPWRTIGPCGLQGWIDFPGSKALWHLDEKAFKTGIFPCFSPNSRYIARHLTRKHGSKGRPVAAGP
jgi:hypothetical protein